MDPKHLAWGHALADELHAEKEAQRLTLDELERRSGVPKVSLQRFLAGDRVIKVDVLAQICSALGVTPGEMTARAQSRYDQRVIPLPENETGSRHRSA
jgi:transcriptional regulator with XRE-family HTH domain